MRRQRERDGKMEMLTWLTLQSLLLPLLLLLLFCAKVR
jgi:hypothetical protein